MRIKLSLFLLYMTLMAYVECHAHLQGQAKVDSMLAEAYKMPLDTNKVNIYQLITIEYRIFNPDSAMKYAKETFKMANQLNWQKGISFALFGIGLIFERKNDYRQAIEYYKQSYEVAYSIKDTHRIGVAYARIGLCFYHLNKYDEALDNYFHAEKYWKSVDNKIGLANNYLNIGLIYDDRRIFDKAMDYYKKSLDLFTEINNLAGIAHINSNIGIIYHQMKQFNSALNHTYKALKIYQELNNVKNTAIAYGGIGLTYNEMMEFKKALEYLEKAKQINIQINDKRGYFINYANIGMVYYRMAIDSIIQLALNRNELINNRQNNLRNGIKIINESLEYFESINDIYFRTQFSNILSDAYYLSGNYKKSVEILRNHKILSDSLNSMEQNKQIANLEAVIENEKQAKEIEKLNIINETQAKLNKEKDKTNQIIIIATIITSLLFIVILFGLYNRYRFKSKTNAILAEKNRYITDSINYAKDIQSALLPPSKHISKYFPEHMILYLPKDIVSGDFYWFGEAGNVGVLAAVDCTGHGVPGAFMSMIGSDILFNIVNSLQISDPAEILDLLHIGVRTVLKQDSEESRQMDGMEVCMIAYDKNNKKLTFAGANRPLWIIKTNGLENEFIEIKGDKYPIGGHQKEQFRNFTNHDITLNGETLCIYLTSDGYPDQKGEDGTFYRSKRLKNMLQEIATKSMEEQYQLLKDEHIRHKGNHEQIDDITIIGIKL